MNITISGRHVKVTEAMRAYAHEKVTKFERIWHGINNVQVIMKVEHDVHIVESIISIDKVENIIATTEAPDMYAAIDLMEEKAEHQLRSLKSKQQDHHPNTRAAAAKSSSKKDGEPSYQDIVNDQMNL
jgi:putative sigma-54 modulation protein